ncbi:hypothetical protein T492DRAFT_1008597 [Pavlovales sp. CCMP2436]|nr:hypothetical protein T492DRAFT_1008597 [Pavlovales sp. CCMP2436]
MNPACTSPLNSTCASIRPAARPSNPPCASPRTRPAPPLRNPPGASLFCCASLQT